MIRHPTDFQVFRVFFKRVLLALKGVVAGGDAAEVCERIGMHSFVEELRPAGVRLQRLFAHNVKASFLSPAHTTYAPFVHRLHLTYEVHKYTGKENLACFGELVLFLFSLA